MISGRTLLQAGVGMALGTTVASLPPAKASLVGGQVARAWGLLEHPGLALDPPRCVQQPSPC